MDHQSINTDFHTSLFSLASNRTAKVPDLVLQAQPLGGQGRLGVARDPFSQPGYIDFDKAYPLEANWIPFNSMNYTPVDPSPDWLEIVRTAADLQHPNSQQTVSEDVSEKKNESQRKVWQQEALDKIGHLRNTTLLLIGDSVDRNSLDHLASNLGALNRYRAVPHDDITSTDFGDWDERGLPHILDLGEPVGLTVANCFIYGLVCNFMSCKEANSKRN